jgi:hypothetical protein
VTEEGKILAMELGRFVTKAWLLNWTVASLGRRGRRGGAALGAAVAWASARRVSSVATVGTGLTVVVAEEFHLTPARTARNGDRCSFC